MCRNSGVQRAQLDPTLVPHQPRPTRQRVDEPTLGPLHLWGPTSASPALPISTIFHFFFNQEEDFLGKDGEGHGHPSSPLLWWYNGEGGYRGPKFGGVEGDFFYNGKEDFYGNVEWNDVDNDGGNLENATGIKHVYYDNTWKYEQFILTRNHKILFEYQNQILCRIDFSQ